MREIICSLVEAELTTDILFDNSNAWNDEIVNDDLKLDAVFIPTLNKRTNIVDLVKELQKCSSKVFILTSKSHKGIVDGTNVFQLSLHKDIHERFLSLASSQNPSTRFMKDYDLPTKRNMALNLSKKAGYKFIGLIDDDIFIEAGKVRNAIALLRERATLVGFYSLNFPDKSAIDLIECYLSGVTPKVSLSGNCLFINTEKANGFFPYVYNEDWLYILKNLIRGQVMGAGTARQCYHEPWNDFERIRFEQFGDIIATGIKQNSSSFHKTFPLDYHFWQEIFDAYLLRLECLKNIALKKNKFYTQLQEAQNVSQTFKASDIISFLEHYQNETSKNSYERIFNF